MWPFNKKKKEPEMMVSNQSSVSPSPSMVMVEVEIEISVVSEVVVKNNRTDKETTLFSINPYGIHYSFKDNGTLVIQQLMEYSETKEYDTFKRQHIAIFRDHSLVRLVDQKNTVKVKRKKSVSL